MTRQLTGAPLLYSLVLKHSGDRYHCAMNRAAQEYSFTGGLAELGVDMGFTYTETCGIMSGWDHAVGRSGTSDAVQFVHREQNPEEFDRGFEIGERAAGIAGLVEV
jgi:hypothetical protein